MSGGTKNDTGKPRISLVPFEFIEGVAKIMTFGAKKYDAYNWTKGFEYSRLMDAIYRHLGSFERGVEIDEESGESHLLHAACGIMFLYMHRLLNLGTDNRWQRPTTNKEEFTVTDVLVVDGTSGNKPITSILKLTGSPCENWQFNFNEISKMVEQGRKFTQQECDITFASDQVRSEAWSLMAKNKVSK